MSGVRAAAFEAARGLDQGPRYSVPRVALDLAILVGCTAGAAFTGSIVAQVLVAVLLGAFPLHDVLVHGHEAIHGMASRDRRLNAVVLWLSHALVGMSGRAHRSFHLDHHRHLGTDSDPERHIHGGGGLVGPFRVIVLSHPLVHRHALAKGLATEVIVDVLLAAVLHLALIAVFGPVGWFFGLLLPASTGLPVIAALRAITEHLAPRPEDLVKTRATRARWLGQVAWSNIDLHVEHHLCPNVPWHHLPELRRRLMPLYESHGVHVDHGLFRTAFHVLMGEHPH